MKSNSLLLLFVALVLVVFLAVGTYAIFFYWNIGDDNKWSTFFSFTSTFGIFATISIYLLQQHAERNKIDNVKSNLLQALSFTRARVYRLIELNKCRDESKLEIVLSDSGFSLYLMGSMDQLFFLTRTTSQMN